MFSSFAALSSSSSIGDAKSTLTCWIGPIMWPAFVKKRETSFPLSARRAIVSAATVYFRLRVLFIKLLLLFRCFPPSHEGGNTLLRCRFRCSRFRDTISIIGFFGASLEQFRGAVLVVS